MHTGFSRSWATSLRLPLPPPTDRDSPLSQAYFDPASLSTLAWAFAAFDLHDEPLFTAIAKKASRRIRHFSAAQMSQVRGAGRHRYWMDKFLLGVLDTLYEEAIRGIICTDKHASPLRRSCTGVLPQFGTTMPSSWSG